MDKTLYPMIFKRKSFHLFCNTGAVSLTESELEEIHSFWQTLTPKFRKNLFKVKRKTVEEIWQGEPLEGVANPLHPQSLQQPALAS